MRAPLLSSLLISAVLALPSVALGQEGRAYPECGRQPTEGDVQAAKGAFQAGRAAYNEGDYARALLYWEDAYRRDCTAHPLLLNMATAYELSGNKAQAIVALETYLTRRSDAPDAEQVTRRLEVLRRQLQETQTGSGVAPGPTPGPTETNNAAGGSPEEGSATGLTANVEGEARPGRPKVPLIVAGAGGAVALVGLVVWKGASSDIEELEKQCPNRINCSRQVAEDGNAARGRQSLGGVLGIAGLAVAIGGTVWYFNAPSAAPQAAVLVPAVAPGFAGVSFSGRF
jgi:tetratricopeptide (TPR) repeat protein